MDTEVATGLFNKVCLAVFSGMTTAYLSGYQSTQQTNIFFYLLKGLRTQASNPFKIFKHHWTIITVFQWYCRCGLSNLALLWPYLSFVPLKFHVCGISLGGWIILPYFLADNFTVPHVHKYSRILFRYQMTPWLNEIQIIDFGKEVIQIAASVNFTVIGTKA